MQILPIQYREKNIPKARTFSGRFVPPERIPFVKAKTLEEAKEYAKKYFGIRKNTLNDLEIANYINKALQMFHNATQGKCLRFREICHRYIPNNSRMVFQFPTRRLYVNKKFFKELDEEIEYYIKASRSILTGEILPIGNAKDETLMKKWSKLFLEGKLTLTAKIRFHSFANNYYEQIHYTYRKNPIKTIKKLANKLKFVPKLPEKQENITRQLVIKHKEKYPQQRQLQKEGYFYTIFHEIGHLQHSQSITFTEGQKPLPVSRKLKKQIRKEVSWYAHSNILEFVAEVFVHSILGKKFSPEIMQLYKQLKGPEIPNLKLPKTTKGEIKCN